MAEPANSVKVVTALETLVQEKALRAISLSGAWGVGKTHLVNQFAREKTTELREAKLKSVYVSLFGLSSIEAVRSRIAANSLSTAQRFVARIPLVAQTGVVDMAKVGEIARSIAENSLLKNLFVVIDDLERMGPGIEPSDVIGLISELIEQFGCKCVLILNRAKLTKQAAEIDAFEEKVFDLTINYQPAVADVLPYGLPREEDCAIAAPVFEAFKCANIRIAKRLSWLLRALGETTFTGASKIWPTIVRQATILAILKYDHGFDRSQLNKVIGRTEAARFMRDLHRELRDKTPDALPADVTDTLDQIDHTDAGFGDCIVDLLETGSLDHKKLAVALEMRVAAERHVRQNSQLRNFFRTMHGGFSASAPDFANQIKAFLQEDLVWPERFDLTNLCDLLLQIDSSAEAAALAGKHLTARVSQVKPESRAKHFERFVHLWNAGVYDRIPYIPSTHSYTLAACFDMDSWEPESLDRVTTALTQFSDAQWQEFLLGLREPNTMGAIRRFRGELAKDGQFKGESREALRTQFERVLAAIAAQDSLFRAKLEDYANPAKRPGPF